MKLKKKKRRKISENNGKRGKQVKVKSPLCVI
jgi:hypothetical protein